MNREDVVREVVARLVAHYQPERIYLIGSTLWRFRMTRRETVIARSEVKIVPRRWSDRGEGGDADGDDDGEGDLEDRL